MESINPGKAVTNQISGALTDDVTVTVGCERYPVFDIRWVVVLAWQGPVVFLSYALILLVVYLSANIAPAVQAVQNQEWNEDCNVRLNPYLFCNDE